MPAWLECAGLSPELWCWRLQSGNLSVDTDGRLWRRRAPPSGVSQLVVPGRERQEMIRIYFMTPCLPDIWESRGQCFGYIIEFTGQGCVTTFVLTWHPVLFVWHASPRDREGLPRNMLTWDTAGIEFPWTF